MKNIFFANICFIFFIVPSDRINYRCKRHMRLWLRWCSCNAKSWWFFYINSTHTKIEKRIFFSIWSRIIGKNDKCFSKGIYYYRQIISINHLQTPIARVIDRNAQWRSITPWEAALWKVTEDAKTAINSKGNLNIVKKVFSTKSHHSPLNIIVRKLSLSIFRRGIVKMTESRNLRSRPEPECTTNSDYLHVTAP